MSKLGYCATVTFSGLFLMLGVTTVKAMTYYVSPAGNDGNAGSIDLPFKTIKQGISSLRAGDTLYIRGGTYLERISSNSQAIPTGNSWADAPVISGYSGETVVLRPSSGSEIIALARSDIKYLIFSDLVLDASNLQRSCSAGYGCSLGISGTKGAHHVRFKNIEVKNAAGTGILLTLGGTTIPSSFEFIGCDVHHNGVEPRDHGFYITTSGNLIKNCKVHDNTGHGIHVYTGNLTTANSNTIDGNDVYNNSVLSGSAPGILITNGNDNRVTNNIVRGNRNGIIVGSPFVSGVTASRTKIYNNTIYGNSPGVGINVFASSSQADVRNNILHKNGGTILNAGSSTINTNNLFSDPRFADELNGNFRLQLGSPAVNQGVLLNEVRHDFTGVIRPQQGAHDLGAYEYTDQTGDGSPPLPPSGLTIR